MLPTGCQSRHLDLRGRIKDRKDLDLDLVWSLMGGCSVILNGRRSTKSWRSVDLVFRIT